jgi:hypothetical protein
MIQEKSTYVFAPKALVPTALVDRGIEWWQRGGGGARLASAGDVSC